MKILGITAEYNPFHNGHKYHIQKSKELISPDCTVIVMSGNFVQRGIPAIYDKWTRAEMAVKGGADLVVELPVRFALSSAENFASGAVYLLNALGATDISFGAEDNIDELNCLYNQYKKADENGLLSEYTKKSATFEEARQMALEGGEILSSPNNILGFEYIKAIDRINPHITPHAVKRHLAEHDGNAITQGYTSASKIREMLLNGEDTNGLTPHSLPNTKKAYADLFTDAIKYSVITKTPDALAEFSEIREGLENRIYKCAFSDCDFDSLVKEIKSKRYTYSAISRMLFQILLGIKKQSSMHPEYIRVLCANQNGTKLLKHIKKSSPLPVITKATEVYGYGKNVITQAEEDFLASDIYFNFTKRKKSGKADLTTSPVIF